MSALTFVNVASFWQQLQQPNADVNAMVATIDDMDTAGYQLFVKLLDDKKITLDNLTEPVVSNINFLGWVGA